MEFKFNQHLVLIYQILNLFFLIFFTLILFFISFGYFYGFFQGFEVFLLSIFPLIVIGFSVFQLKHSLIKYKSLLIEDGNLFLVGSSNEKKFLSEVSNLKYFMSIRRLMGSISYHLVFYLPVGKFHLNTRFLENFDTFEKSIPSPAVALPSQLKYLQQPFSWSKSHLAFKLLVGFVILVLLSLSLLVIQNIS